MTPEQKMKLRKLIVAKAVSHLGEREIGTTNTGKQVDAFLAYVHTDPGNSWCSAFADYIVGKSAEASGFSYQDTLLIKTASVQEQVNHAIQRGTLVSAHDAISGLTSVYPGDLMVEWEPSLRRYAHTGILETAPSVESNAFTSIEGNTDTNGNRQGIKVARQHRNAHDKASDGRAKYAFVRSL